MRTFKDFLAEAPEWQNSLFDMIMTDYLLSMSGSSYGSNVIAVPMSHSAIAGNFNIKGRKAGHIADIRELPNVANLQGKKSKHISTLTQVESDMALEGIWGGGGTMYILRGDVLAGGNKDIWSAPTKQGTRVVELSNIMDATTPLYKKIEKHYTDYMWQVVEKELRAYGLQNLPSWQEEAPINPSKSFTEKTAGIANYFNRISKGLVAGTTPKVQKDIGKIKNRIITKYMDYWGARFSAPTDTWFDILFSNMDKPTTMFDYNEIILSNFTIEKVITLIDERSRTTTEDQEKLVDHFIEKYPSIKIIKTYNRQDYMKEIYKELPKK